MIRSSLIIILIAYVFNAVTAQSKLTLWIADDSYHDHSAHHHDMLPYPCDSSYYIYYTSHADDVDITLKNEGSDILSIDSLVFTQIDGATFSTEGTYPMSISPGEMFTLTVDYQLPESYVDGINGSVMIHSNDPVGVCSISFDVGAVSTTSYQQVIESTEDDIGGLLIETDNPISIDANRGIYGEFFEGERMTALGDITTHGRFVVRNEYSLPDTVGSAGQILQVNGGALGRMVEWSDPSVGAFENSSGVVRSTGNDLIDDLIFGRATLPQNNEFISDNFLFFDKSKGAFRVGGLLPTPKDYWSLENVGAFSFASGADTRAYGDYSTSLGLSTEACGESSTSMGYITNAYGDVSTSIGAWTYANGYASTVVGMYNDSLITRQSSVTSLTPLFIIGNGDGHNDRSNAMVVRKDGKVGIGNVNPQANLHILGSSTVARMIIAPNEVNSGDDSEILMAEDIDGSHGIRIQYDGGTNELKFVGRSFGVDLGTLLKIDRSTGDVDILGALSKGSGTFKIDHPLDPLNKYLYHSFVESPDMMNVYNGNVILDTNGEAVVEMAEWFSVLNMEYRYQLTCIGGFAQVYIAEEISDNHFKIAGGSPGLKVSWQVTGIRQDPYAQMNRVQVEEIKPTAEQGTYLHPKAYGQTSSRATIHSYENE